MQIHYQRIENMPDYIAWIECNREDLEQVRDMFPEKEFKLLIAVKPNYDPITCSQQVLYNPPAPTWGIDVWKREIDGRCEGLSPEEDSR